ncbi:MAG TPA: molybdopterin-dependent oxidoreductase, partial [Solirubrobacteraceae bacterium]|nr:molybdopterin-dependent oxidoreductase [Solirubrobacteraceae bacterium]
MTERITYCRICEANCGMVATVEGDRVTQLRPDREHPLSSGYACPKGIAFPDVQHDPDRVTHPLRRVGDGFERVAWDEALDDIAARLGALPRASIGWYLGNPAAWSFGHAVWAKGFVDALGSPHFYSSGSQDVNNRFAASALMYGSPLRVPIPDIERTDFLLMVGANPFVSNGSVFSVPRVRDRMHDVVRRGGRVVVVDPRRTETARHFEHVPILPDGDAWLLLSMLQVIGPSDARLAALVEPFTPEATAARTGLDPALVRSLARDLAA